MRRSNANDSNTRRGSGDNKPIRVKVIDKSSPTSTASIHKLSRGEICKTLTNIRSYLQNNATPVTPKGTPNDKGSLPISADAPLDEDEIVLSSSSENIGFLTSYGDSLNSIDLDQGAGERSIIISPISDAEEYDEQKGQLPWVLKPRSMASTTSSKPKPPKPQNSAASSSSNPTKSVPKSKCSQVKPPHSLRSRPKWTFGSGEESVYASDYSYSEAPTSEFMPEQEVENPPIERVGVTKKSAIYRFQRFLERTRKPRGGVEICVKPQIDPGVMSAIQELYGKHYNLTNISNWYNQDWDGGDSGGVEYVNDNNQQGPFVDETSLEPQPTFEDQDHMNYAPLNDQEEHNPNPMYDNDDQYGNYQFQQPEPPTRPPFHQASTNNPTPQRQPHPELLLDFLPEPKHSCRKRLTKFAMNMKQLNRPPPPHGSPLQHHPDDPITNDYQNFLMDQYNNYANQFKPPPPTPPPAPYPYHPYMMMTPQGQQGQQEGYEYYGNQVPPHHPPQGEQYFQNYDNPNPQGNIEQGNFYPNSYQFQNYHHQFQGY